MLRIVLLSFVLIADAAGAFGAPPAEGSGLNPIKREILALYDGARETDASKTRIHRFAEMPLNHLGFSLVYRDVGAELPPSEGLARYAAVLTWFGAALPNRYEYFRWAIHAVDAGIKFIILDSVGGDASTSDIAFTNDLLGAIGLRHSGEFINDTRGSAAMLVDRTFYDYEARLGSMLPAYPIIAAQSDAIVPILKIETPHREGSQPRESVLAAIGSAGAYVAPDYALRYDKTSDRFAWLLDPFRFFKQALGAPLFPVPDVTTVSGNRIYFSHVDGHGFRNASFVEGHRGEPSSQVALKELIAPYPDLPVTFGLIAGDVSSELGGDSKAARIATDIFAQPQVEAATAGATEPYRWDFFARYDRAKEVSLAGVLEGNLFERAFGLVANRIGSGAAGMAAAPRAYPKKPFDLDTEVRGAVDIVNALAPSDKRVRLFQWSGDAEPYEAAIKRTREANLLNMNGGETRLDREFPSVAYVAPISRMAGHERQIYAVGGSEETYTRYWAGPIYGFVTLLETAQNTENPRRLKGFNVHYQALSAQRLASLNAVKTVLEAARKLELTPITASRYAEIADGFFSARIVALSPRSWSISERGALNTVRFDDAEGLAVDFEQSQGVLGESRHAGSLYVALDAKIADAIVAVRDREGVDERDVSRPALTRSRWRIENLQWRSVCDFAYEAQGFGGGLHVWRTGRAANYGVTATRDGGVLWTGQAESGADGLLSVALPNIAVEPLLVEFKCR